MRYLWNTQYYITVNTKYFLEISFRLFFYNNILGTNRVYEILYYYVLYTLMNRDAAIEYIHFY